MEFNILQSHKGLDKQLEELGSDPFDGNSVGTSLFMTGNMGPKIKGKNGSGCKKSGHVS